MSRANALTKRLAQRGNPASVTNTLLRPVHPLFADQEHSNAVIIKTLSSEMESSVDLAKMAEGLAKEYHASHEAVNRAETLCISAEDHLTCFDSLVHRLEKGVKARDGDGTPPNLDDIYCLEPTSHSAFLALFPSILEEIDEINIRVDKTSQEFVSALLRLDRPGIDHEFKVHAASVAEKLSSRRLAVHQIRDRVSLCVNQLRHVRKVKSSLDNTVGTLEELHQDIEDSIKREKWTPQATHTNAPLTPESSMDALPPSSITPADALRELDALQSVEVEEISSSFSSIASALPANLGGWMTQDVAELRKMIEGLKQMSHLWKAIRAQSSTMNTIVEEATDLRAKLEDLKSSFDDRIDNILDNHHFKLEIATTQGFLSSEEKELRESIQVFIDGLSRRVPFISNDATAVRSSSGHARKRSSLLINNVLSTTALRQRFQLDPPVDPTVVDNGVRADCNQLSMTLSGAIQSLQVKNNHLRLAQISNATETALRSLDDTINRIADDVNAQEAAFNGQNSADLDQLGLMAERLNDILGTSRAEINRSLSRVRGLIAQMENSPDKHDGGVYERMVLPRNRRLKEAETRFNVLAEKILKLKDAITEAQRVERERLARVARVEAERREQERRDEEERLRREKEERERQEKEKEERERRERERLEAEERARRAAAERKRLDEEMLRKEMEKQELERREAEERETKEREAQARQAAEERERLQQETDQKERERREREQRDIEERERIEALEREKEREEQARREAEAKEKREQAELQKSIEARKKKEAAARETERKDTEGKRNALLEQASSTHSEKSNGGLGKYPSILFWLIFTLPLSQMCLASI
jgi:hypothetical protein